MNSSVILSAALIFPMVIASCSTDTGRDREDIVSTGREFAIMAGEAGVAEAFYHYAADSAVILRGGKLIRGREAIRDYYIQNQKPGTKLLWTPDYTDVSGDLGYTYGKYTRQVPDSTGNIIESYGMFHTVWKRQPDGSWRFVWD
ncbi:MAG: hypothetical protein WAW07_15625 [Bacteroidales bacterium]